MAHLTDMIDDQEGRRVTNINSVTNVVEPRSPLATERTARRTWHSGRREIIVSGYSAPDYPGPPPIPWRFRRSTAGSAERR